MNQYASISCKNCGGSAQYRINLNSFVCQYCESQISAEGKKVLLTDDTYDEFQAYIPFTKTFDEFKDKAYEWLIAGNDTPADILRTSQFSLPEKVFVPYFYIKGKYSGSYNIKNLSDEIITPGLPLQGSYSFFGPATSSAEYQQLLGDQKVPEDAIPFDPENIDDDVVGDTLLPDDVWNDNDVIGDTLSPDAVWNNIGKLKTAQGIYSELKQKDPTKNYDHRLQYKHSSITTVYFPVWSIEYSYPVHDHIILMDDRTGKISGSRPLSSQQPPTRTDVLKKCALIGLGIWFFVLVLNAAYQAFIGPTKQFNNILFSPPAELFWFIRGLLTIVVFPFLMAVVFYSPIKASFYDKHAKLRKKDLDMIRSGRMADKISQ